MSKIKKEYLLDGLDCAHCAIKIEEGIHKIKGISSASMNFTTKTLMVESESLDQLNSIMIEVNQLIKKLEPHVIVQEKIVHKGDKRVLILMGLGCANCAAKIEKEVNNLPGIQTAHVDFVTKKLTIEAKHKHDLENIIEQASKIAKQIESGIEVTEEENGIDEKTEVKNKIKIIQFGLGALIFLFAVLFRMPNTIEFILYFTSYLLVGGEVLISAVRNLIKGQLFDENFLMSVATIGAFAIKEYPEGVAVMLFYQVGEFFQDLAVNRSRKSITALMDIRPDFAHLKVGDTYKKVSPDEINIGDIIIIKPGEKVPLDGIIIEGFSTLDTSALTGESIPREVEPGNEVLSGSINKNGLLTVQVSKAFGESTVSKILDMVQYASSKKAPTENFITKFAKYYTPIVVFSALALAFIPPLILQDASFSDWIHRALVFLVVSCPCALVISIPLSFFGGIGGASQNGILIKGSNYLEALNNVHTIVFDKTGTLTKGIFKVTEIVETGIYSQSELLEFAAYAESYSNHPIATSIQKAYKKAVDQNIINDYDEISGHGIKVVVNGKTILVGNTKLMDKNGISYNNPETLGTIVHIAVDGIYAGYIVIADELKEDSIDAIKALRAIGIKKLVMLTGDSKSVGEMIGNELGLDSVYTELLPNQKVEKLEMLEKDKPARGKLIFVGDGINDAPVLARADVGVAMGGLGSDAAIEAADVVLMNDEPSKLVTAIMIAKRTRSIVWQNIFFALAIKGIVLILGAGGIATIWEAVFADVGVAVLAILNAMRVMKVNHL